MSRIMARTLEWAVRTFSSGLQHAQQGALLHQLAAQRADLLHKVNSSQVLLRPLLLCIVLRFQLPQQNCHLNQPSTNRLTCAGGLNAVCGPLRKTAVASWQHSGQGGSRCLPAHRPPQRHAARVPALPGRLPACPARAASSADLPVWPSAAQCVLHFASAPEPSA